MNCPNVGVNAMVRGETLFRFRLSCGLNTCHYQQAVLLSVHYQYSAWARMSVCWITGVLLMSVSLSVLADFTNLADVPCGSRVGAPRPRRHGRIVGGVDAAPGEFPWLVSIKKGKSHVCGGTILNHRWVLTAAHCLCSGSETLSASNLRVSSGAHDLRQARADSKVTRLVLHPDYSCDRYHDDIALLLLAEPLSWSSSVSPACLPQNGQVSEYAGSASTVAGWGWTDENYAKGYRSDVLQKVQLTVVGNTQCQDWYRSQGKKLRILDTQICAGTEQGGKDACQADSGGPLMVDSPGGPVVVGVVSAGIGCARPRLPGLYTRISHYIPWITESINKHSS